MRQHLAQMFERNKIEKFPQVLRVLTDTDNNIIGELDTNKYGLKRKLSPVKLETNKKQINKCNSNQFIQTNTINEDINLNHNNCDKEKIICYVHNNNKTQNTRYEIYHNILLEKKDDLFYREKKQIAMKKYYESHQNERLLKANLYYKAHENKNQLFNKIYYKLQRNEFLVNSRTYYKERKHKKFKNDTEKNTRH